MCQLRRSFLDIELALQQGSRALADELERLLETVPAEEREPDLGDRVEAIMQRIEALLIHDAWPTLPFADELRRLAETLRAYRDAASQSHAASWPRLQAQLHETYEALARALRAESVEVRMLRPANYARSAFHMCSAIVALFVTLVVFDRQQLPWVAGVFAATAWSLEVVRRFSSRWNDRLMAIFRPLAHPAERERVNSATWYMTSLVVLASTHSTLLAVIGVAVLGFADPIASLVGRNFGKVRLINGRTLEGSLGFFVAGTVAAFCAMALTPNPPPQAVMWLTAAAAALAGAIAEAVSRRVDDNLSVPLSAAAVAALALMMLGVSPWA